MTSQISDSVFVCGLTPQIGSGQSSQCHVIDLCSRLLNLDVRHLIPASDRGKSTHLDLDVQQLTRYCLKKEAVLAFYQEYWTTN